MRKLTTSILLTLVVLLGNAGCQTTQTIETSSGNWKYVAEDRATTIYVDFNRIKQNGDDVRWWRLDNYKNPITLFGALTLRSYTTFFKGDCKSFGSEKLGSFSYYGAMGEGEPLQSKSGGVKWNTPRTKSSPIEITLKSVCDFVRYK
jgi:hypothetical protein